MAEYFFDTMTIGQLREMTEQYKKLQVENKILRAKYPNKAKDMDNSIFVLQLPKNLPNWDRREEIFNKMGFKYAPLILGGINRGQKINFKGRKVWLTYGQLNKRAIKRGGSRCPLKK